MKGGNRRNWEETHNLIQKRTFLSPGENEVCNEASKLTLTDNENMEAVKASIIAEIQKLCTDVKQEVSDTAYTLDWYGLLDCREGQLTKELTDLRGEMNNKLRAID